MKTLSLLLVLLASIPSSFAATVRGTVISTISERNSTRSIIYSRTQDELVFSMRQGNLVNEIAALRISVDGTQLHLKGDKNRYQFEFMKDMLHATGDAYSWCIEAWTGDYSASIALIFPVSVPLCAVIPSGPFLLGVLAFPVDSTITVLDRAFDSDVIAARKFAKMLRGNDSKIGPNKFNSLISQIKEL